MKPNRDQKNYINYFRRWEGMSTLGAVLLVVGLLCLWLGGSIVSLFLMLALIPAGIVLFLYGSIGRATEGDFKRTAEDCLERIKFDEVEEEPRFRRRYLKTPEIFPFSDYLMREGVMLKRRGSGHLCSSHYVCAKMMVLTDAFYIKAREFSFVSDEKTARDEEILFASIEKIEIVRQARELTFGKVKYNAKTCELVITYDGGKTCTLPVKDDIYAEEFAERLERIVKKAAQ